MVNEFFAWESLCNIAASAFLTISSLEALWCLNLASGVQKVHASDRETTALEPDAVASKLDPSCPRLHRDFYDMSIINKRPGYESPYELLTAPHCGRKQRLPTRPLDHVRCEMALLASDCVEGRVVR